MDMICPGHGPILRSGWKEKDGPVLQHSPTRYLEDIRKDNRVLMAYVSAYGYTREMACQLAARFEK